MYSSETFRTLRALTKFLDKVDPPEWSFSVRGDGTYVLIWRTDV